MFILVDGSESVPPGSFVELKTSIRRIALSQLTRGADVEVAVGEYSDGFTLVSGLQSNASTLGAAIDVMAQSAGETRTGTAVSAVVDYITANGRSRVFAGEEQNASRVLLLLTDGRTSSEDPVRIADAVVQLEATQFVRLAAGVGTATLLSELELIAGTTGIVREFGDFGTFLGLEDELLMLCPPPATHPGPCRDGTPTTAASTTASTSQTTTGSTTVSTTISTSPSTSKSTSQSTTPSTTLSTTGSSTGSTTASTTRSTSGTTSESTMQTTTPVCPPGEVNIPGRRV